MDAQHTLDVPQGSFTLHRRPFHERSTLRAWDAGDELLLHRLGEHDLSPDTTSIVVNDTFGALACALSSASVAWHSDSWVSTLATADNLTRNGLSAMTPLPWPLGSTASDGSELGVVAERLVLMKVPKTLSLLEDQLHRLRPHLGPGSLVVAAGMTKHVHTSTLRLFDRIIGASTTSLARKKARLIFSNLDPELRPRPSPHPLTYRTDSGITTVNHAGLFSQTKLDIGTRFLLETLPDLELGTPACIVDLACGNGILGAAAASRFPDAELVFADESAAAVASAEATWQESFDTSRAAPRFLHIDILDGVPDDSADLVLLNPPFHEAHAVSVSVSPQMFAESRRILRPGGHLVVVANRHLGYHQHLARAFPTSTTVRSNEKFLILHATN